MRVYNESMKTTASPTQKLTNVPAIIAARGVTYAQAKAKTGLSNNTLGKILSGAMNVQLIPFVAFCELMEIDPREALTGTELSSRE
jgi:hypothetical protein